MKKVNLNTLRSAIRMAQDNKCEEITLTIRQAQDIVLEAEQMHGGNCELSNYRVQIADLTEKVKSLTERLIDTKRKLAMKPEDRAASLLEKGL